MNKIQFVSAYTQEILRENIYQDVLAIKDIINIFINGKDTYFIDDQQRTLKAEYVSHTVIYEEKFTIYKVFLKTKLMEFNFQ